MELPKKKRAFLLAWNGEEIKDYVLDSEAQKQLADCLVEALGGIKLASRLDLSGRNLEAHTYVSKVNANFHLIIKFLRDDE